MLEEKRMPTLSSGSIDRASCDDVKCSMLVSQAHCH